jgi:hypothetical protein
MFFLHIICPILFLLVQGERKEQNFDIKKAAKEAGEASTSYTAVKKQYIVPVTKKHPRNLLVQIEQV